MHGLSSQNATEYIIILILILPHIMKPHKEDENVKHIDK